MSLTKEDLMAISELMDGKLEPIDKRLDGIDRRLDAMDIRIANLEEGLKNVEFRQNHTNKKLTNLQLDVEIMERNIRKDILLLKDGLDTVVEVLQQNELLSC